MARRLTMGLLCCTTAGAAAFGISMNPSNDTTPIAAANSSALTSDRADALQRANRSQARTAPTTKPSAEPAPAKPVPAKPAPAKPTPPKPLPLPSIRGLSWTQVQMAYAIDKEGHHMGISRRGRIIAMATALQESNLKNYTYAVDHDSLGLFQQRPSTGWGTPKQLTNPTYAAHAFYAVLVRYKSLWGCLTCAAQKVQRSAFPSAYAKHERFATQIVDAIDKGRKF